MQKVSVVIPAYNEEKWIGKTLEAILAQDYPNYEVIVVDNASTDKTSDIVRGFSDARLKLISEPRKGLLFAREAGRREASGSIIAQLDADCLPDPKWISKGALLLADHEDWVGVTGPYVYYDASPWLRTITYLGQVSIFKFLSIFVQTTKRGGVIIGGNCFIRKSAIDSAGGYATHLDFYGEDTDTACRIAKYGWIKYTPKIFLKTSARRLQSVGFFTVLGLYGKAFTHALAKKDLGIAKEHEEYHPR